MKIKYIFFPLIILSSFFLLFSACEPVQFSVFRAVIDAKPEQDNSLNNALSIIGIVDDGTNYYLAASSSMWTRPISLNDSQQSVVWDVMGMPAAGAFCTAFALSGTELYAGFIHPEADGTYTSSLQKVGLPATLATPAWQPVSDALTDNKQIVRFFTVNGELFVNVLSGSSYALYYLNGANFAETGITGTTSPVTSLIWDGAAYWAVISSGLYKGSASALAAFTTNVPALTTGYKFNAVFRSSAGKYFLSANNGLVYASDNPDAGWTACTEQLIGSKQVYFTEFTEINANILAGTMNYGFYQMPGGDTASIARYSNDQVSDIMYSSVLRFYTQPAYDLVFFLTGSNGLYRNSYTAAGGWSTPVHE